MVFVLDLVLGFSVGLCWASSVEVLCLVVGLGLGLVLEFVLGVVMELVIWSILDMVDLCWNLLGFALGVALGVA